MRRSIVLALTLAAIVAAAAAANVPAGNYTGHYGSHNGSKVDFTVRGGFLRSFHAFVPAYCFSSNSFQFVTFAFPKARIRGGKVKATYVLRDQHGTRTGQDHLTATFHGGRATGTLSGSYVGCTIATYHWTARRR